MNYLAEGSDLASADAYEKTKILQWQFFEQYSHEAYIAVARFIFKYIGIPDDRKEKCKSKQAGGHKALKVVADLSVERPELASSLRSEFWR